MDNLSSSYWCERYNKKMTGWDLGEVSPPIKAYFDQVEDKSLKILIPGCGSGYEGAYLFTLGFHNVHLLDFASQPLDEFKIQNPHFPSKNLHHEDFFKHEGKYDIIIEQTLFCAINTSLRKKYAEKMKDLLNSNGRVIGLLFNRDFPSGPPFGGSKKEYEFYFKPYFMSVVMEECYNSIEPRKGSELFIQLFKLS